MSTSANSQTTNAAPSTASASARRYDIDSSHSSASFKVRHLMVSNVRGEFGAISGTVFIDDVDVTRSSVEVSIDASTINTHDAKRDEHLRSADFFDVAQFPTLTFKSKRVQPGKGGDLFVTGDLTIHGVTREITLDVEPLSPEVNDPWGNVKRGASARARVNRKDFNLVWNATLDGGGVLVGDEVSITLEVELGRKAG
ncbi:MAG TPA: YceI family protein [Polyangia bacterium]|jgi:polyisoprenoid-binding protein YceI|nr:YceI family protein [Polyangia bacterium]